MIFYKVSAQTHSAYREEDVSKGSTQLVQAEEDLSRASILHSSHL